MSEQPTTPTPQAYQAPAETPAPAPAPAVLTAPNTVEASPAPAAAPEPAPAPAALPETPALPSADKPASPPEEAPADKPAESFSAGDVVTFEVENPYAEGGARVESHSGLVVAAAEGRLRIVDLGPTDVLADFPEAAVQRA